MTGANAASMQLSVLDNAGNRICPLDDNNRLLGSYPVDSGMTIHVSYTKLFYLNKKLSAVKFFLLLKKEKVISGKSIGICQQPSAFFN